MNCPHCGKNVLHSLAKALLDNTPLVTPKEKLALWEREIVEDSTLIGLKPGVHIAAKNGVCGYVRDAEKK